MCIRDSLVTAQAPQIVATHQAALAVVRQAAVAVFLAVSPPRI